MEGKSRMSSHLPSFSPLPVLPSKRGGDSVSSFVIRECLNICENKLVILRQSLLQASGQHRPSASLYFLRLSCHWSWGPSQLPSPFPSTVPGPRLCRKRDGVGEGGQQPITNLIAQGICTWSNQSLLNKLLTQPLLPPPLPALPSNSRKEAEGEGGPANSQPLAAMELGLRLTL